MTRGKRRDPGLSFARCTEATRQPIEAFRQTVSDTHNSVGNGISVSTTCSKNTHHSLISPAFSKHLQPTLCPSAPNILEYASSATAVSSARGIPRCPPASCSRRRPLQRARDDRTWASDNSQYLSSKEIILPGPPTLVCKHKNRCLGYLLQRERKARAERILLS